jgi:quercetin dioxygenase-like cupin family protein
LLCASPAVHQVASAASVVIDHIAEKPFHILSRTLHNDDHAKFVMFGVAPGRELLAHTAPMVASLNSVRGEAKLTLGEDVQEVKAGA